MRLLRTLRARWWLLEATARVWWHRRAQRARLMDTILAFQCVSIGFFAGGMTIFWMMTRWLRRAAS